MNTSLKNKSSKFSVGIGAMSGTSLDGLDLAACQFQDDHNFELLHFTTVNYNNIWKQKLETAHTLSGLELRKLEIEYSEYTAQLILDFLKTTSASVDFIACHGHTVFHQPKERLTLQIIDGSVVAALTGITTVCDFRSGDVALGGQGAPLVPIGDKLLFKDYDACLNLGGFANISYEIDNKRVAFDISPANIILNHFAKKAGFEYDNGGLMAKKGKPEEKIIQQLDALAYYHLPFPKSLGREWVEENVLNLFENMSISQALATAVEHISNQIANSLNQISTQGNAFVTGGGAHNTYLIERISKKTEWKIAIPAAKIIDAKEAIIFAFLGKLRLDEKINVLSSVTGAVKDSIGGCIYY